MDIEKSLRYPMSDPQSPKKLLISGLFFMPGGLIIVPLLIPVGYAIAALRKVVRGEEGQGLPDWEYFADNFRWGLMTAVVSLVYMLVPAGVMIAEMAVKLGSAVEAHAGGGGGGLGVVGVLMHIVTLAIGIVLYVPLSLAVARAAVHDSWQAGFDFREIISGCRQALGPLVRFTILAVVMGFLLGVFFWLCNFVPLLGMYPVGVLFTYIALVLAHELGMLYREYFGSDVKAAVSSVEGMAMTPDKWKQE